MRTAYSTKNSFTAFAGSTAAELEDSRVPALPASSLLPARTRTPSQTAVLLRWARRNWDLAGVLLLIGSSAAYGVSALAHLGL